ncbi:membrane protein [Silvimonas iriomotensis]|uniref:Polyamine export protein n=1 Tax=Silvimonas iriomotensis TaxID=449662 RepID=A0ABQ2PDV5_9NEIS|nr:membrane protein [Silvimonas iriomotensis]
MPGAHLSIATGFFLLVLLIALSAFFSMSEISLASARKFKLQMLAEEGEPRAQAVIDLQDKPGDFFTVVQIGVNAVAILGGIVGDATFTPFLLRIFNALNPDTAGHLAFLVTFFITTSLFIQFADLIPKRLGMVAPEQVAIAIVRPMRLCSTLLKPFVLLFNGVATLVLKLTGMPTVRSEIVTADEIVALVDAGAEAGTLHKQEHRFIENVFELAERYLPSAMTGREAVVYFSMTDTDTAIRQKIAAQPHAKFPLCENSSIDTVFAYIDAKDLLHAILKTPQAPLLTVLREIAVKGVLVVPDTLSLADMLDRFRETREDFAVIINEYALVVGVITLNDVTGQLIGSIVDNSDEDQIVRRDERSWLADGMTPIGDLKRAIGMDDMADEDSYDTLAGFLMLRLKRIPKKAEAMEYEGFRFEVVDIDHHKIDQVLVSKL